MHNLHGFYLAGNIQLEIIMMGILSRNGCYVWSQLAKEEWREDSVWDLKGL